MLQAHETMDIKIFDVQQNDSLARQILHVYYRTPDPSGEIYSIFPTFFLVQPSIFDAGLLAFNKQEVPLIENCKRLAQLRSGWVGVSPYFDKKFAYHWVKYAVYPFMLGDADAEYQDEFFYLLHQFVVFTQKNPTVYGDLTEDASTDNDVALMLAAIRHNAANMNKKLQHYPEQMLLVFDATWPTSQVKTLLAALEINAKSWNHLFLEHLRYVMRKNKGLVKAVAPVAAIAAEALIQAQHSTPQNALEAVRASNISNALFNSSMVSLDESVRHAETPQFDDVSSWSEPVQTFVPSFVLEQSDAVISPVSAESPVPMEKSLPPAIPNAAFVPFLESRWLVNLLKLFSLSALLLAAALSGFLVAQFEQKKMPQVDVGLIHPAALPSSAVSASEDNLIVVQSLQMSRQLADEK